MEASEYSNGHTLYIVKLISRYNMVL